MLNHFPEGVFQKCRVAIEEEYRMDRLRSKKLKKLNRIAPEPRRSPQELAFLDDHFDL